MTNILISLFSLGWMEILDPQGYALIVALSSLVEKKRHVLLYIFVSYVTYASCGVLIFLGMDRILIDWFLSLTQRYPQPFFWARFGIGIAAIAGFCILGIYLFKLLTGKITMAESRIMTIRNVHPVFIAGTSFVVTVANMTGALAMIAFISVLSLEGTSTGMACVWLFIYTLFALFPKLVLYFVLFYCRGPKIEKIKKKIGPFFQIALFVIIWLFLGYLVFWGIKIIF